MSFGIIERAMVANGDDTGPPNGVKSVETTISIAEALQELEEATLTEIAGEIDLSKGAVYKHMVTLERNGFVTKENDKFRLGFRFLDFGVVARSQFSDANLIQSKTRELASETDEVAVFAIEENDRSITLFRESGSKGVFTRSRVGKRLPLHQTASGKAMLAHLPQSKVREILDNVGLASATENSVTDEEALFEELKQIREQGYAINRAESTGKLRAVGVPVIPEDTVIGGIAIAGPHHRMDKDRLTEELPQLLLSVVNELELNIAYSN